MTFLNNAFFDTISILTTGYGNLKGWMTGLFYFLFLINLLVMAIKFGFGMKDAKEWINKLLNYGIWTVAIFYFPQLMTFIRQLFSDIGMAAAGKMEFLDILILRQFYIFNPLKNGATDCLSPAVILNLGMLNSEPLLEAARHVVYGYAANSLFYLICWFLMIASYVIMTIQYMITYIEFAVLQCIGGIFMPFGIIQETRFLPEKFFGAALGHGIKMLLLNLIIMISFPVLRNITLIIEGGKIPLDSILTCITMSFVFMMLAHNIPQMAVGILSGSPALNDASFANSMRTVVSAVRTAGSIMAPLAQAAMQGGVAATGGLAKAVGAGNRAATDYKASVGDGSLSDIPGQAGNWLTAAGGSLANSLGSGIKSGGNNLFNRMLWGKQQAMFMSQLHAPDSLHTVGRAGEYMKSKYNSGNNRIRENVGGNNIPNIPLDNKKPTFAENTLAAFSSTSDNNQQPASGLQFNFDGDSKK